MGTIRFGRACLLDYIFIVHGTRQLLPRRMAAASGRTDFDRHQCYAVASKLGMTAYHGPPYKLKISSVYLTNVVGLTIRLISQENSLGCHLFSSLGFKCSSVGSI